MLCFAWFRIDTQITWGIIEHGWTARPKYSYVMYALVTCQRYGDAILGSGNVPYCPSCSSCIRCVVNMLSIIAWLVKRPEWGTTNWHRKRPRQWVLSTGQCQYTSLWKSHWMLTAMTSRIDWSLVSTGGSVWIVASDPPRAHFCPDCNGVVKKGRIPICSICIYCCKPPHPRGTVRFQIQDFLSSTLQGIISYILNTLTVSNQTRKSHKSYIHPYCDEC